MASFTRHYSPPAFLKAVKVDALKHVIRKGDPTPPRWWLVSVGKRLTGTRKIRRFFPTEKRAKEYISDVITAAEERGRLAFAIPQGLAVEAMELLKLLAPHNATLTDAVKFYLRHVAATASKTVEKLLPDYLQTKANPNTAKIRNFRSGYLQRSLARDRLMASRLRRLKDG